MSILVCFGWGYLLYMGTLDTLWRMLGIANQLLAAIALAVGTTYLLLHAPKRRYALCTGYPVCIYSRHSGYRQRHEHSRLVGERYSGGDAG